MTQYSSPSSTRLPALSADSDSLPTLSGANAHLDHSQVNGKLFLFGYSAQESECPVSLQATKEGSKIDLEKALHRSDPYGGTQSLWFIARQKNKEYLLQIESSEDEW